MKITPAQLWHALWLSLFVSGLATVIGAVVGIPLGVVLAEFEFPGKRIVLTIVHAFMGLPPVVVGVFTYAVIARHAIFGSLGIIYTPAAMVLVQVILAAPIIAGFAHASIQGVDPRLGLQARSLGASRFQAMMAKAREARAGMVAAVIAGFGRVIAEVGAVTIVGGAITGQTDTLTTISVKLTRVGRANTAMLVGLVLIGMSIAVNVLLTRLQDDRRPRRVDEKVTGYAS